MASFAWSIHRTKCRGAKVASWHISNTLLAAARHRVISPFPVVWAAGNRKLCSSAVWPGLDPIGRPWRSSGSSYTTGEPQSISCPGGDETSETFCNVYFWSIVMASCLKLHLRGLRVCLVYLKVSAGFIPQYDMQACEGLWRQLPPCVMACVCVGVKITTLKKNWFRLHKGKAIV